MSLTGLGQSDPALPPQPPRTRLRQAQIIALSFVAGSLVFMGVAITLSLSRTPTGPRFPIAGMNGFFLLPLVLLAAELGIAALLARVFTAKARAQWAARTDDDSAITQALNAFTSLAIIRLALFEGVALLAACGMLLTGDWMTIAPWILAIIGMFAFFPTSAKLQRFLTDVTDRDAA